MKSSTKIGRLLKNPIGIHYSWILVFILMSWAISTQYSVETPIFFRIAFGLAASILFLFAILLRELVLFLLAIYKGVVVKRVTVFPFGGLLQVTQETTTPSHELLLALAGMLWNVMIVVILFLAYVLSAKTNQIVIDILLKWLAFFYFTVSLFHIIPAFPLEGGRILHVLLWKALNNTTRATLITSWIGLVIGLLITLGGISILLFTVESFTGIFLIVFGLILLNGAKNSRRQSEQVVG